METELKLKVAQPDLVRLSEHPLLKEHAHESPREHRLTDTYYDTPKLELWRHGITLRVREEGAAEEARTWIQTVKTASAGSAALHERGEWECSLSSAAPQPSEIARQIKVERIAKLLHAPSLAKSLRPVFTNTTRRTIWDLELPDGQLVECALDSGNIDCKGQTIVIGELELELKKGNPTQLFELALALHEDIPLQIANDSKASRGYALLDKRPPSPVKAKPLRLNAKMSLEDAFHCIGLNCLRQMEANVPGVLTQSVESLHQMRVGLRRLRAVLDMFSKLTALPAQTREGLEWLAGELGATRDWDVLATSTLDRLAGADAAELKQLAAAKAHELHKVLLASLADPRYTQLLLELNGWFHGRHWRNEENFSKHAPLATRISNSMKPLLAKAQKRLTRRIRLADKADPAALHGIRIAAKKSRYAAEFFMDVLPRRAVKHYISSLSQLQDRLGSLNDLEVAKRLLLELEDAAQPRATAFAIGYLSCELQANIGELSKILGSRQGLKMPIHK